MRTTFFLLFSILILSHQKGVYAQEKDNFEYPESFKSGIVLLNGKILSYPVLKVSTNEIEYGIKSGASGNFFKTQRVDISRVFSYPDPLEKNAVTVLYKTDLETGNDLTLPQMRKSVMGSIDAKNNYKAWAYFTTGAVISYAGVIVDTYLFPGEAKKMNEDPLFPGSDHTPGVFKSDPSVFPIFIPIVFSIGSAFPKTRLRSKHVTFEDYKNDTYYQMGFERVARQKKVLSSITGSFTGLALGYLSYFITNF